MLVILESLLNAYQLEGDILDRDTQDCAYLLVAQALKP